MERVGTLWLFSSVHKAGFSSPNLALKAWRTLGELLVSACVGTLKKKVLIAMKECCSNRMNGLTRESKGKEGQSEISFFLVLGSGLPPKSVI